LRKYKKLKKNLFSTKKNDKVKVQDEYKEMNMHALNTLSNGTRNILC